MQFFLRIARLAITCTVLAFAISLTSCTSTVMAAFDAIDPASRGLTISGDLALSSPDGSFVLRPAKDRNARLFLILQCRRNAGLELIAPSDQTTIEAIFKPEGSGEIRLSFTRLYQFMNWEHGWSEYQQNVLANFSLKYDSDGWHMTLVEPAELADFQEAAIKNGEKILRGDRALSIIRNRNDRIEALVAFAAERIPAEASTKGEVWSIQKSWVGPSFKNDLKTFLFPELIDRKLRPSPWKEPISHNNYAEGIHWNRDYSEALLPVNLVEIRQSGTLLRDWEEALAMIYARWRWPSTIDMLTTGVTLQRVKP